MNPRQYDCQGIDWWRRRRVLISSNVGDAIKARKNVLEEIARSQRDLNRAAGFLNDEIFRLQQIQGAYGNNEVFLPQNPITRARKTDRNN